jgi:hypothetical protein
MVCTGVTIKLKLITTVAVMVGSRRSVGMTIERSGIGPYTPGTMVGLGDGQIVGMAPGKPAVGVGLGPSVGVGVTVRVGVAVG